LEIEARVDPSWPSFEYGMIGRDVLVWLERNRSDVAAEILPAA
jgi:hypothetical protein